MSTQAYANMRTLCVGIEGIYASAVCSGIVGNAAHRLRGNGTYHLSRQDNPAKTYSVIRTDDVHGKGPEDAASAFDISMSTKDMILATRRLAAVWATYNDPRRKYLNAFNGWLGSGDARRYDMIKLSIEYASPDHKWHVHGEVRRLYVLSAAMVKAVLSAFRGETVTAYLTSIGVKPNTPAPAKPGATAPAVARPTAPKYPGHVLRYGDRDPALKLWQARMYARGWHSIGKADGAFGAKTLSVVKRYQADSKVTVDGQIGPKTWPLPWSRPLG